MSILNKWDPSCWSCSRPLKGRDRNRITCAVCRRQLTVRHKLEGWRAIVASLILGNRAPRIRRVV